MEAFHINWKSDNSGTPHELFTEIYDVEIKTMKYFPYASANPASIHIKNGDGLDIVEDMIGGFAGVEQFKLETEKDVGLYIPAGRQVYVCVPLGNTIIVSGMRKQRGE